MIAAAKGGPAFVVGHAFGNRVARLLATTRPDLVRAVGLIAANVGRDPSPPKVREAIKASADLSLPDDKRLAALQFAFFAPGNDAHAWLNGWHRDVLAAERIAGDKTPREEDYAAGHAPVLYLQPDHDPLGRVEDAQEYKRALGERVTVVVIANASHAVVTEQPAAVAGGSSSMRAAYGRRRCSRCIEIAAVIPVRTFCQLGCFGDMQPACH